MLVDKVHGLNSTGISLNDRFTILATAAPDRVPEKPRPRRQYFPNVNDVFDQNLFSNRNFIQQLARRLEQQARRLSIRQRLGVPQGSLRRFGSETSLPGLRRANSFSNLSQNSVRNRVSWRQSNGNLSRSASFNNLSGGWRKPMRGFRRRGVNRNLRGGFRGNNGWFSNNMGFNRQGASMRGRGRAGQRRGPPQQRGRGQFYNQNQNPVPTKEELDNQLDQYMSSTKTALDRELDQYMKDAMEIESSFV